MSALATDLLGAHPPAAPALEWHVACAAPAGAARVVVFGYGPQTCEHVRALLGVRALRHVVMAGRDEAALREAVATLGAAVPAVAFDAVPAGDTGAVRTAVGAADVVCTCTSSPAPLFDGRWLRAGAHVNCVGAFTADAREVDSEVRVLCAAAAGRRLFTTARGRWCGARGACWWTPWRRWPRAICVGP